MSAAKTEKVPEKWERFLSEDHDEAAFLDRCDFMTFMLKNGETDQRRWHRESAQELSCTLRGLPSGRWLVNYNARKIVARLAADLCAIERHARQETPKSLVDKMDRVVSAVSEAIE